MIAQGMSIQDAVKEYQVNNSVITANDGELKAQGTECIDCNKTFKEGMRFCQCDEGLVCQSCCGHCDYNEDGECRW
jgi:hypothetical protein